MSGRPAATLNAAFDMRKHTVSPADGTRFQSTTLEDVWRAARDIERVQKTEAIFAQSCAYKTSVGWARKVLEDYRSVVQWNAVSALGLGEFLLRPSDGRYLTSENKGPYQVLTPGMVISNPNLMEFSHGPTDWQAVTAIFLT
jgi:hypothetical protein